MTDKPMSQIFEEAAELIQEKGLAKRTFREEVVDKLMECAKELRNEGR